MFAGLKRRTRGRYGNECAWRAHACTPASDVSADMDCVRSWDNYGEASVASQLLARGSTWGKRNTDEMIGVEPLDCSKNTAGVGSG